MTWRELNALPSRPVGVALFPSILMVWTFVVPVLPGPSWMQSVAITGGTLGTIGLPLIVVVYPIIAIIALGLACVPGDPPKRRSRLQWGGALLLGMALMALLANPTYKARRWAIKATTRRAVPLIQALEKYRNSRGHYPSSLAELVPDQIERIPASGMMGDPEWRYQVGSNDNDWKDLNGGKAPAYDLMVDCFMPGITFDTFHYWPSDDYPHEMYGGVVERIGEWAYVHE